MPTSEEITIKVSPEVAQAYRQSTESEKRCVEDLINLFFEENISPQRDFLGQLMDHLSDRAVSRGLTPEILESILNE